VFHKNNKTNEINRDTGLPL